MEEIESSINRYLTALDAADRQEPTASEPSAVRLEEKIAKADGRFNKDAFVYDATKNEYICPAGEALPWRFSSIEKGMNMHCYWAPGGFRRYCESYLIY